jgi:hypothetical protein
MGSAHVFYRWFTDLHNGKYVAVVVVSELAPRTRHWIITAYLTRRSTHRELEWAKD